MLQSKSEFYSFDEASLEDLRTKSPWTSDPKFFTNVSVSPTAIVKMLTHCQSGVEKGIKQGGRPIEVMGEYLVLTILLCCSYQKRTLLLIPSLSQIYF